MVHVNETYSVVLNRYNYSIYVSIHIIRGCLQYCGVHTLPYITYGETNGSVPTGIESDRMLRTRSWN